MAYRLEKTTAGYDIVIDGFENGVAESPYAGIGDMRNVDPSTIPGEASVAMKTEAMLTQGSITSATFTVNDTTDVFTYNGLVPLEVNTVISVSNSGGALPTGMATNTIYYVKTVPSSTTFTLSAISAGGATLNVSSAGSGTNSFSTINMGTPKFIVTTTILSTVISNAPSFRWYFLLDSNGRCWVYDNVVLGGTNKWVYMNNLPDASVDATSNGNGLIAWKNWVMVWSASSIKVIPLINANLSTLAFLTTNASWSSWQTSSTIFNLGSVGTSHYPIISQQDENVYFANGFGVGSIIEIPGETFAPNTGRKVTDGVTTNGSATITSATIAFTNLDIGSEISGTGIPAGTFIKSRNSASSAELTQNATASASGLTFYIGGQQSVSAGSAANSYTFNSDALAIATTDEVTCLAELGTNLLVGGILNNIYVWDRISIGFNYIIYLSENYVTRMVTVNTTTYIFAGRRGRISRTNGSNADEYWKIPDWLSGTVNPTFLWTDATFNRDQLYFSFQVKTNSGTTVNEYGGLWTIDISTNGGYLSNKLSYGTYSGYASALLAYRGDTRSTTSTTGVFGNNTGYGLFVGWNDGTNGGIDRGISTPYTAGESYIDSDMIPIGTFLTKKTFQNLEWKLSRPLVSGESISIYYRVNINDSFTLLGTTTTAGLLSDQPYPVTFEMNQWLQTRTVLTSTASSPSFVRLRELRIR